MEAKKIEAGVNNKWIDYIYKKEILISEI